MEAEDGGCWGLQRSFRDPALERLYQSYSTRQKRAGLRCFLYAALLYDVYALAFPAGQDVLLRGLLAVFLTLNLGLLAWCYAGGGGGGGAGWRGPLWAAAPHLAWHLANAQLLATLFLQRREGSPRDLLGWALLLDYLLFVSLPLRLRYCAVLSAGTCASYLVAVAGLARADLFLPHQVQTPLFYLLILL